MTIITEELARIRAIAEADKEGVDGKAWDETITPDTVIALCDEMLSLWNALPRAMTWRTEPRLGAWN